MRPNIITPKWNSCLHYYLCDAFPSSGISKTSSLNNATSTSSDLPSPSVTKDDSKSKAHTLPIPRTEGEILSSPCLKAFTFTELKNASKNFRADTLLGEGGFGCVHKAWIDQQTLTAAKSGSGMVVAVKKLKPEGFQGHREWLVCFIFTLIGSCAFFILFVWQFYL